MVFGYFLFRRNDIELRTPTQTKEERTNMTRDELLCTVRLLDEAIESFRWILITF